MQGELPTCEARGRVFISYASQDAEAASSLAGAIRESGVDVWLDQSELRGGDAWDEKLRQQIAECQLFVPIISAATEARREGYFRIEWKLAAERTYGIADGTPFLMPVVIDATNEQRALVPKEFRRVHWSRLSDGTATPDFLSRITRLTTQVIDSPAVSRPQAQPSVRDKPRSWQVVLSILALVCVGIAVVAVRRHATDEIPVPSPKSPEAQDQSLNPKSIAVLPFTNMSDSKDNAYFCDGVQDELLTDLAAIRDLQVVSRTTAAHFRDSPKTIPQIGKELHVSYILEGSVRRSGFSIRVTAQLINAVTDTHVWAKSFDRELKDVFAIQSELARTIAEALQAAIDPREQALLDHSPTANLKAHDLFLQAQSIDWKAVGINGWKEQRRLYEAALELDPNYAQAWVALARVYAAMIEASVDTTPEHKARTLHAIAESERLAGGSPDLLLAIGSIYLDFDHDTDKALQLFDQVLSLQPNSAMAHGHRAYVLKMERRYAEAIEELRKAKALEPSNRQIRGGLVDILQDGRRWQEALLEERELAALAPNDLQEAYTLALAYFRYQGDEEPMKHFFSGLTPGQAALPEVMGYKKDWAFESGDVQGYIAIDRSMPLRHDYDIYTNSESAWVTAFVHLANADSASARAAVSPFENETRQLTITDPTNDRAWSTLAIIDAILGKSDESKRAIQRATEIALARHDDRLAMIIGLKRSQTFVLLGDKEAALAELSSLLSRPGYYTVFEFARHPYYWSLHGDPRFSAMMEDPKNRAPLY